jgi:hypothetical protein
LKEEIRKLSRVQQQQPSQPQSPKSNHNDIRKSPTPNSESPKELPRSASVASISGSVKEEDEINLEYLRNVIIKFLESKSTRAQLIPVLTMMLKFTPEEIRRLNYIA